MGQLLGFPQRSRRGCKVTKRQFTLMVDGKLRVYDHPPEPPGYTVEQMTIRQWLEVLAAEQCRAAEGK